MPKETRTYPQRAEYLKKAVSKRRKELRIKAVKYLGGKCFKCGYNKCFGALEFHHIDPTTKLFSISVRGLTRSGERIVAEINKCELLYANCHREKHWK